MNPHHPSPEDLDREIDQVRAASNALPESQPSVARFVGQQAFRMLLAIEVILVLSVFLFHFLRQR